MSVDLIRYLSNECLFDSISQQWLHPMWSRLFLHFYIYFYRIDKEIFINLTDNVNNEVNIKNNGKIRTSVKPDKL